MRAGAGKLQVATVAVGGRRSPPRRCPRRWCARCRRPTAARSAPTPPTRCATWPRRPTPSSSGRAWPTRRRPRRSASGCCPHLRGPLALDALGLACVTADDACLHHLDGRVVLTPNPTELAYALHVEEDEIEDDPAGAAAELAGRAQAVVGLGGRHVVDRRPRRPALAGRQRRRGPGRLRLRRRARRDHRRAARPRRRPGAGRGLGGLPARPRRGAAGLVGGPARLPGPRAAGRDPAGARRDHRPDCQTARRRRGSRRTAWPTTTSRNCPSAPRRSTTTPSSRRRRSWWAP